MTSKLLMLVLLVAFICAGCVEKGSNQTGAAKPKLGGNGGDGISETSLHAIVTSPRAGAVLSGSGNVDFRSRVDGGKGPYTYSWSSSLGDCFSSQASFNKKISELSKGEHLIILKVTDSLGQSAQATTSFRAI
jgi:hypothetical protein